jgi:hypothetical protein
LENLRNLAGWSLDKEGAEFFRDEYIRNHSTNHMEKVIREKRVKKDEIIAIFNSRKEKESYLYK